jgi:hypothetical protein
MKSMTPMKTITKPEAVITTSLLLLIAAIALVLILSGCSFERIEGNYDLTTETRPATSFDEVISSGSFQVLIYHDTLTSITVKAESNILPYLYTISDGSTLRLGFKNGYNIHENYPVQVIIHSPHARILRLQGSGKMEATGFHETDVHLYLSGSGNINTNYEAQSLSAEVSGSGDIDIAGTANSTSLEVSGSGSIRSLDMPQKTCNAHISGSGNIYSSVSGDLDVHISGSGCVYYSGSPTITTSISGSGRVIKY